MEELVLFVDDPVEPGKTNRKKSHFSGIMAGLLDSLKKAKFLLLLGKLSDMSVMSTAFFAGNQDKASKKTTFWDFHRVFAGKDLTPVKSKKSGPRGVEKARHLQTRLVSTLGPTQATGGKETPATCGLKNTTNCDLAGAQLGAPNQNPGKIKKISPECLTVVEEAGMLSTSASYRPPHGVVGPTQLSTCEPSEKRGSSSGRLSAPRIFRKGFPGTLPKCFYLVMNNQF